MEDTKNLLEQVKDHLETYYQLITIAFVQKVINIVSGTISAIVIVILGLLSFGMIGLGLGWWLGNLLNSRMGRFFLAAGIYVVIMAVIIVMRKKARNPFLRNLLAKKIYE